MSEKNAWTVEDVETNIKANVKDYGGVVTVSALFLKLYGRLPNGIGLSGAQAGFAEAMAEAMPPPKGE